VTTPENGNAFILGHPYNGVIGSPAPAQNGSQIYLGSGTYETGSIIASGTEVPDYGWPTKWGTWGIA